jgi:hypothetical protein
MFVAVAFASPATAASADPFNGVWSSLDTDGDSVRFAISAPNAGGTRVLEGFDPAAETCDGSAAVAHGSGTVVGGTLTARLIVSCDGTVVFTGSFHFTASGDTLISDTSLAPYTRVGGQ